MPPKKKAPPIKVYKFGGVSVGSPEALRTAATLVETAGGPVAAVVSAMSGVTDRLLEAARAARAGDQALPRAIAKEFRERHLDLVQKVIPTPQRAAALGASIEQETADLVALADGVRVLRELTPRTQDAIVARGERVLARIFAALLAERRHVKAGYVDATAVIFTERRFGSLWPDLDRCTKAAAKHIAPLLRTGVAVMPGFIGTGPDGEVVTLGRGGTDFSAAILARGLGAESVTLWKEVDGLMTADPRSVPEARVLPDLHFREAAELAFYGAKVLHPRTMIPLVERGIPLYVRNTFNPAFSGTRIAGDVKPGTYPVKALTAIPRQALVSVEGSGMMGVPGVAARTFDALARAGHSVSMISQASSESSICFVVPEDEADHAVAALREAFALEMATHLIVDDLRVEREVALIAVVGMGMKGMPGIAARAFTALARGRINVVAIAQGSSELNITIAVRQADAGAALRALHREYQLEKIRPLPHVHGREASVAVLGFGQIGRALVRQLVSQERYFADDLGLALRVTALADRSGVRVAEGGMPGASLLDLAERKEGGRKLLARKRPLDLAAIASELRTSLFPLPAYRSILVDTTAEETAGLLREALDHRFHLVLANKKPLAVPQAEFDGLFEAARAAGLSLRYEATVGAGLPVLDTLRKLAEAGDRVETVLGCLSGTLGYVVTQLEGGTPYSVAVRQAWELGYTEPDPRDDLGGVDVARKALILARTLGRRLDLTDIAVEPLFPADLARLSSAPAFVDALPALDGAMKEKVEAARRAKKVLRYVARIEPDGIRVGLEAVPEASPLGRLQGTDNQVVLHTRRYRTNPLVVTGPGAGAEVTAAGVLNDVIAVATGDHR